MPRTIQIVCWYIVLTVAASIGMLLSVFPHFPKMPMGWVWLFVFSLPVTIVGEFIGNSIWKNRVAKAIERRTSERSLSWLRICYGFVVMLLVFGTAFYFSALLALKV